MEAVSLSFFLKITFSNMCQLAAKFVYFLIFLLATIQCEKIAYPIKIRLDISGHTFIFNKYDESAIDVTVKSWGDFVQPRFLCETCQLWCSMLTILNRDVNLLCEWQIFSNLHRKAVTLMGPFIEYMELERLFSSGDHLEMRWKFLIPAIFAVLSPTPYMRVILDYKNEIEIFYTSGYENNAKKLRKSYKDDEPTLMMPCSQLLCQNDLEIFETFSMLVPATDGGMSTMYEQFLYRNKLSYYDLLYFGIPSHRVFFVSCEVKRTPIKIFFNHRTSATVKTKYIRVKIFPPSSSLSGRYPVLDIVLHPRLKKKEEILVPVHTFFTCSANTSSDWNIGSMHFFIREKQFNGKFLNGANDVYSGHVASSSIYISGGMYGKRYHVICCAALSCYQKLNYLSRWCVRDSINVVREVEVTSKLSFLPQKRNLYPGDEVTHSQHDTYLELLGTLTRRGWRETVRFPYEIHWNNPGGYHTFQLSTQFANDNMSYTVYVPVYRVYTNAGAVSLSKGDVIECFADAYPPPTVQWFFPSLKEQIAFEVIQKKYLKVISDDISGQFELLCLASNFLDLMTLQIQKRFLFYIESPVKSFLDELFLPQILHAILYMVLLAFAFVLIRLINR